MVTAAGDSTTCLTVPTQNCTIVRCTLHLLGPTVQYPFAATSDVQMECFESGQGCRCWGDEYAFAFAFALALAIVNPTQDCVHRPAQNPAWWRQAGGRVGRSRCRCRAGEAGARPHNFETLSTA